MAKHMITFWKDTGHVALRDKTVELFRISWNDEASEWVRDPDGPYWGIEKILGEGIGRLPDPETRGRIESFKDEDDIQYPEVHHLEAEDISVTPEGLNLGEEE